MQRRKKQLYLPYIVRVIAFLASLRAELQLVTCETSFSSLQKPFEAAGAWLLMIRKPLSVLLGDPAAGEGRREARGPRPVHHQPLWLWREGGAKNGYG